MGQTGVIGNAETVFASNWWIVVQTFKSDSKHIGSMGIGDSLGYRTRTGGPEGVVDCGT